jgi:hypothetical protein
MSRVFEIFPYDHQGMLVFDDATTGLDKEPLVQGTPEILYSLCALVNVENPKAGFTLKFSEEEFDGFQAVALKVALENGGCTYQFGDATGWLCPMLYKYFVEAPEKIYFKVAPLP